ncbi:PREDICTED: mucin-5AC-like [Priapulus caudatus]|uniref:Mucin-5AC-like n=1 Tax=Priapulus caudatus TaxID=37621 RepID=A0ABM1EYT8_PRICU|nr:PREDICTED: mucin-5AC-like [Priapulus caudatus]
MPINATRDHTATSTEDPTTEDVLLLRYTRDTREITPLQNEAIIEDPVAANNESFDNVGSGDTPTLLEDTLTLQSAQENTGSRMSFTLFPSVPLDTVSHSFSSVMSERMPPAEVTPQSTTSHHHPTAGHAAETTSQHLGAPTQTQALPSTRTGTEPLLGEYAQQKTPPPPHVLMPVNTWREQSPPAVLTAAPRATAVTATPAASLSQPPVITISPVRSTTTSRQAALNPPTTRRPTTVVASTSSAVQQSTAAATTVPLPPRLSTTVHSVAAGSTEQQRGAVESTTLPPVSEQASSSAEKETSAIDEAGVRSVEHTAMTAEEGSGIVTAVFTDPHEAGRTLPQASLQFRIMVLALLNNDTEYEYEPPDYGHANRTAGRKRRNAIEVNNEGSERQVENGFTMSYEETTSIRERVGDIGPLPGLSASLPEMANISGEGNGFPGLRAPLPRVTHIPGEGEELLGISTPLPRVTHFRDNTSVHLDLMYVTPTPMVYEENLYLSFIVMNYTGEDGDIVVSQQRILTVITEHRETLQDVMAPMNLTEIHGGMAAIVAARIQGAGQQPSLFRRHQTLFAALLAAAAIVFLIVVACLALWRHKRHSGSWNRESQLYLDDSQSAELKYRPNYPFYWDNPLSDHEIKKDEDAKDTCNGDDLCVISLSLDDEVDNWVVPYEDYHRRDEEAVNTHL